MSRLIALLIRLLSLPLVIASAPLALLAAAACNLTAEPPATLQVRLSTPLPTPAPAIRPTATPPVGISSVRPIDPSVYALLERVQNDRLMFAVSSLTNLQTRHVLSATDNPSRGIGAARDWLLGQFNALRAAYPQKEIDIWTQPVQFEWRRLNVRSENIVAVFPGADVGAGVLVVGAHYDSIGTDPFNGNAPAPGANDNASGVAAMLEIAHIMAPVPHRATLVFVAFTAEETGRQGSMAFVQNYLQAQNPPIAIRGMINLDMIGSDRGPGRQRDARTMRLFSADPNDSASRQLARQFALIANTYVTDMNLVMQSAVDRVGRWGDHQSFSEAGYAAVRLIQGVEDPARQHGPQDNLENVQLDYLMRATRVALAGIIILADGPTPPPLLALRPSTESPGALRLSWLPVPGASGYLITLRNTSSLFYDQILTITPGDRSEVEWDGFGRYASIAISAMDANGRMGPFSLEYGIASLRRP
jgi:hypothetical protein